MNQTELNEELKKLIGWATKRSKAIEKEQKADPKFKPKPLILTDVPKFKQLVYLVTGGVCNISCDELKDWEDKINAFQIDPKVSELCASEKGNKEENRNLTLLVSYLEFRRKEEDKKKEEGPTQFKHPKKKKRNKKREGRYPQEVTYPLIPEEIPN